MKRDPRLPRPNDVRVVQTHSRVMGTVFVGTEGRWAVRLRCPDGAVRQFWTEQVFETQDGARRPFSPGLRPSIRFDVLRRDGYTCRYCGRSAPDVPVHVDHVIPRVEGGTDDPSNLVTACQDCNLGKGVSPADRQSVARMVANDDALSVG